jgi:hypothetical protein
MSFNREPVRLRDRAERGPCSGQNEQGDEDVARQIEAAADDRVDEDDERERQQSDEHRLPQAGRPPEHGGERLRDARVDARSGRSDDGGEPGYERSGEEEEGIDRPAVPAPGLAGAQQRDIPAVAALTQRGLSSPETFQCHNGSVR